MILVDAGPLIAILSEGDQYHALCTAALRKIRPPMGTVWPVISEAIHILSAMPYAQKLLWDMVLNGAIQLLPLDLDDVPRIRELMQKYSDLPMDLADAALIRVAERDNIRQFFTIDRTDFSVYRLHNKIRPSIIP